MSFKSKDLAYDAKEPAFLQRIRGHQSGKGVDSDRHERPIARPRGAARANNDDDDDAPTYVVEDSNTTLSKAEYEALLTEEPKSLSGAAGRDPTVQDKFAESPGIPTKQEGGAAEVAAVDEAKSRTKQEVTEVGGQQKKRKAARVVGVAGDDGAKDAEKDEVEPKRVKQVKRKVKPVKLSFDAE